MIQDESAVGVKDNFEANMPQASGWTARYIGRGVVRYNYSTNTSLTQTASNITTAFSLLNVRHKLLSFWAAITTSGGTAIDNTGPNTLSITHQGYGATYNETIWANANTATGTFQAIFDQSDNDRAYQFATAQYIVNTNCPNTDLAWMTFEVYFPDWKDNVIYSPEAIKQVS
jgi:hypothetical protein